MSLDCESTATDTPSMVNQGGSMFEGMVVMALFLYAVKLVKEN
jgi:hypothetical protein